MDIHLLVMKKMNSNLSIAYSLVGEKTYMLNMEATTVQSYI